MRGAGGRLSVEQKGMDAHLAVMTKGLKDCTGVKVSHLMVEPGDSAE